jgi:hypothetical protein
LGYILGNFFTNSSGHPANKLHALAEWSSGIAYAIEEIEAMGREIESRQGGVGHF